MKTAGIIAEYNPFHNGHAYLMNQVRSRTGAEYVIVVLSGNFTQRGIPAMLDKYQRAKMALLCGADLVLELPCLFACSSAEHFALGGVSLLNQLGVVDFLGFGCENDSLELLQKAAGFLLAEPDTFRTVLQKALRNGSSFPAARSMGLAACMGENLRDHKLLSSPNNILAIEYLKSLTFLSSSIQPVAVRRVGSGYGEKELHTAYSSALAIRSALLEQKNPDAIRSQVPDPVFSIVKDQYQKTMPLSSLDFSLQLHYKLLLEQEKGYAEYVDISEHLSARIQKKLPFYRDFDSFCMLLKSRDMTYTRICRCMLHILLNIRKEAFLSGRKNAVPYARVLGFRQNSTPLLKRIKEASGIPLLMTASDAKSFLQAPSTTDHARALLETDLTAARIYSQAVWHRFGTMLPDEFGSLLLKI